MRSLSFFLAWRYLTKTNYTHNISFMTGIALCGITIGTFALALVSAVMSGFEMEVHKKLRSIHAPIIAQSYGNQLNAPAIKQVLNKEFPQITAVSAGSNGYAIVYSRDTDAAPDVVLLRGIEPEYENAVSNLQSKIITHEKHLPNVIANNHVLIGAQLANNLGLTIGDELELAYASDNQRRKKRLNLETHTVIINGLFQSGIDEFDSNVVFCSLEFLHTIFPEIGTQTIRIAPHKHIDETQLINQLKQRLQLNVYSWKELYPALVSALKLEKYAMFLILALIILVASMSIISLLFMRITQKRSDIAILKAMGAPHQLIIKTFICVGSIISFVGCSLGLALAFGASWILNTYPFIELPDSYYVSHLPAHFSWQLALTIAILVMIIGLLASWIPAHKTQDINISQVLRFE